MKRPRITIRVLLIAMVPIAPVASVVTMVGRARVVIHESQCHDNAFFLGIGLLNCRSASGRFPTAVTLAADGKTPMHSWRSDAFRANLGLTFASYNPTLAWDSPANLAAASEFARNFACPNTRRLPAKFANYVAVVDRSGRSTLDLANAVAPALPPMEDRILIVEWPESDVAWTEPRDLPFEALDALGPGRDPRGLAVVFADGSYRRIPRDDLVAALRRQWPAMPSD